MQNSGTMAIMDVEYDTCEVCEMYFMPKKQKELTVLYDTKKDEVVCICNKCVEVTDLAAFEWLTDNKVIINQFIKLKQRTHNTQKENGV